MITKDIYDKKHQQNGDKKQLLNIEMEEHTKANHDYQTTVATVYSLAQRAKDIFESSETDEKQAFLNYLLQNPTVKEKELMFTLRSPFNLVLQWADCPKMGHVVEEVRTVFERKNDATVYIPDLTPHT